jgi:hypothetical protein
MNAAARDALSHLEAIVRRWAAGEAEVVHVVDRAEQMLRDVALTDTVTKRNVDDHSREHELVLTAADSPLILAALKRRRDDGDGDAGYAEHVEQIDRAGRLMRLRRNPFYSQPATRVATWGPGDLPHIAIHDHEGGREAAAEYFRSITGRDPDLRGRARDREIVADRVVRIRVGSRGRLSAVEVFAKGTDQITRIQFWRYRWTGTGLDRNTLLDLLADWESERIAIDEVEVEAAHYRSIVDAPPRSWSPWACAVWDVMERLTVASLSPLSAVDVPAIRAFLSAPPEAYEDGLVSLVKYFAKVDWDARRAALAPAEAQFVTALKR